jgi:DNA-binding response OmpR family regulator
MNRVFQIMVVEDSETQAFKLQRLLEEQGWEVSLVSTAEAALIAIADPLPNLVLVDYNLPGMRGDEFCRRIRINPITRGIPILMMTSTAPNVTEISSLESGADDYVAKSAGPDILLLRIRALLRRSPAQPPISHAWVPDSRARRILAIDDSQTYLAFLSAALRDRGYEIETAAGGAEGLSRLAEGGFDCVLVDLVMPGMDGIEVCRQIGAMSKSAANEVAVIILTGADNQFDLYRGLESGADDFICKSGDLAVLLARVRALMRRRGFQEENQHTPEDGAWDLDAHDIAETGVRNLAPTQPASNGRILSTDQPPAGTTQEDDDPVAFVANRLSSVESRLDSLWEEVEGRITEASMLALREARVHLTEMRQVLNRMKELSRYPRTSREMKKENSVSRS